MRSRSRTVFHVFYVVLLGIANLFVCSELLLHQALAALDSSGNGNLDLTDFIIPLPAVPHTISTGEQISYEQTPNDASGRTVRMHKSVNWEQFVDDGTWIRRREDTSWAPNPGPGGPDVHCNLPGNPRAVYTLTSQANLPALGEHIRGSAGWLHKNVTFSNFVSANHETEELWIAPINMVDVSATDPKGTKRNFCQLAENIGVYPPDPSTSRQKQIMDITYYPTGTFTFCSGIVNQAPLVEVYVKNGFGTGDRFFFMEGWGFVGFQDPTGRNAGLGSGGDCGSASSGSTSSGADEEGPVCVPGSSKLKIKGTLKSSRLFTYDPMNPDKLIRVPEQDSKNSYARDYAITTNQKVAGAVVAVYKSQKVSDPPDLPPGVKMVNFTGKKDGKIVGKAIPDFRTKADGMFEVETSVTCEEIWDGAKDGWKQYLVVMCPDNPDGSGVRMMLKDLYSIHLRPGVTDAVLDLRDINVDCDVVPPSSGVLGASTSADGADVLAASTSSLSAPNDLNYVFRNKDTFLACSGTPKLTEQLPATNYSHRTGDHRLSFGDEYSTGTTWNIPIIGGIINTVRQWIIDKIFNDLLGNVLPFRGRTEGRLSLQRVMCDMRKIYGTTPGFFRGVKEGFLDIPNYFSKGAPAGVDTFNNYEEKQEPFNCEMLRRSALVVGEEGYEDFNTQTSGGFFNNLGIPFGGLIKKADGSIDPNLSGDAARYLAANKSTDPTTGLVVCKDDAGTEHYLGEFMPLEGYCGDLDNSGALNGGEMPCPERFSCGDYNGNGINVAEGEVDCASVRVQNDDLSGYGRPGYYKFDVRYFPQFALDIKYTRTLGKEDNYRIFENNDDKSDWCGRGVYDGGWFNKNEGAGGVSRPDTRAECHGNGETSQAFLGQLSVRRPSTINGVSFFTTLHTLSADKDATYPHHMVMSSPQFVDSSDSAEIVKRSVSQAVTVVKSEDVGGVSRIGSLDSLCSCSLVEDGTNSADAGLGNCFHDAQAIGDIAPDPRSPLNSYDSTQDYKLSGEGGNYGVFDQNSQPNKVVADYDWGQIKVSKLVEKGERIDGDKSPTDTHYEQRVASSVIEWVVRTAHNLIEIIQCGILNVGGTNNTNGSLVCGRRVNMIGKGSTWTPFKVKSDYMRNWYVVGEVLTAPFTLLPDIDSVCEEDSSYTKAYEFNSTLGDSPDSKGKEVYEGESFENSLAYLVNSAKPPTFEGEYTACRMVPGWQVTEYPGKGLFAADCLSDGNRCWVGGAFAHENWRGGTTTILSSSDGGNTWSESSSPGSFIHGLGLGGLNKFGVGKSEFIRNIDTGSSYNVTDFSLGYLYDVAGVPGIGYFAGATSNAVYSQDGQLWRTMTIKDKSAESYNYVPTGLGCGTDDIDDYDYGPFYPRNCVPYNYKEDDDRNPIPANCDNDPATALPQCCCELPESPVNDPNTPDCTGCWGWGYNSNWGVDCNPGGDCIMVGARAWSAKKSDMLSCMSKTGRELINCMTDVWWKNAKNNIASCPNINRPRDGNCLVWSVSYPSALTAYASTGGRRDVYLVNNNTGDGRGAGGGGIVKTENGGLSWTTAGQNLPAGLVTSLRGVDCYSDKDCVAVGTNGVILKTIDGATWTEAWKDDPKIITAKSSPTEDPENGNVQFLGVAYPNASTVIAVGYIPNTDGSVKKGVIYTLGEVEVCEEPEPGPGPGPDPEPGVCDFTLDQSCNCGSMSVTASGAWTYAVGDLSLEIKRVNADGSTSDMGCANFVNGWQGDGGSGSLGCGGMSSGNFKCHHTLFYSGNGCNTNVENTISCP